MAIIDRQLIPIEDLPDGVNSFWVVTSPNMLHVPKIEVGIRNVHARKDGRYGTDDYTQHPQLFSNTYPYLSVIRRNSDETPMTGPTLSHLWYDLTQEDWVAEPGTAANDIGRLAPSLVAKLKHDAWKLSARISKYQQDFGKQSHLSCIETDLWRSRVRLEMLPGTFHDIQLATTQFQRLYLEGLAYLEFKEIYEPRIISGNKSHLPSLGIIGAWTFDAQTVQRLYQAGIPVWYVRDGRTIPHDMKIHSQPEEMRVEPMVEQCDREPLPFPIIYQGKAGAPLVNALHTGTPFDHRLARTYHTPSDNIHSGGSQRQRYKPCERSIAKSWSIF